VARLHPHADHDHGNKHGRGADRRSLAAVFVLTTAFMVAEVVGGLLTGSLALLADAGHMISDAFSRGRALRGVAGTEARDP
jgi:cobalt-zinc-cadmium efflux system protein